MRGLVTCLIAAAACGAPPVSLGPVELERPHGSGEPNLFATPDGRVILTWLEPTSDTSHALMVSERTNGAWSEPNTIVERSDLFVNWADFPSLVEDESGSWLAHWLQKVDAAPYAYHVMTARSRDRGVTWSTPMRLHSDSSPTEHGFVAMVPVSGGGVAAAWLDGRATGGTDHDDPAAHGDGAMTVRFATVGPDGAIAGEDLVDDRVCDCCQTALARTSTGLVAAYRDRSTDEVRDVVVTRFTEGAWSAPVALGNQGWEIGGCPVNGPALEASGDTVVVAWFTAADESPRVYSAFSLDGGISFAEPVRVDDGQPLGRVDVATLAGGRALVIWLERGAATTEIRGRIVEPAGGADRSWPVAESSEARASGFPRVARVGSELVFAWTAPGPDGGVWVSSARWR